MDLAKKYFDKYIKKTTVKNQNYTKQSILDGGSNDYYTPHKINKGQ